MFRCKTFSIPTVSTPTEDCFGKYRVCFSMKIISMFTVFIPTLVGIKTVVIKIGHPIPLVGVRSVIALQPVAFVYYITQYLTICIIFNYVGF